MENVKDKKMMSPELAAWFDKLEQVAPKLADYPGYMKHVPLSAVKFAKWTKRFQAIVAQQRQRFGSVIFTDFDTETTGLNPAKAFLRGAAGVTDIGAVKIVDSMYCGNQIDADGTQHPGDNVYEMQSLMNPGVDIPEDVSAVTHITNEMVMCAPAQYNVLREFKLFAKNTILLGHNIGDNLQNKSGYDLSTVLEPIFNRYFNQEIGSLRQQSIDTLPMFQGLCAGIPHTNTEFAAMFGIKLVGAHRAMPDVRVHAKAFSKLLPLLEICPAQELMDWANNKLDRKNFYLQFLRAGADYSQDHQNWIEFGIKMDKVFNKGRRRQSIVLRYDYLNDQFEYQDCEIGGKQYTAAEIAAALPDKVLRRQAAILKKTMSFTDAVRPLYGSVVF